MKNFTLKFICLFTFLCCWMAANGQTKESFYTVAGDAALCGFNWDPSQNVMTKAPDGTWSVIFKDIPAGNYAWKVCKDGSWTESYNEEGVAGDNALLSKSTVSDVTITFNPATKRALASCSDRIIISDHTYTMVGSEALFGSEWNPTDKSNDMEKISDGQYKKIYTNVPAGTYYYKIAQDYSWGKSWPNENGVAEVKNANETLTFLFDAIAGTIDLTYGDGTTDYYSVSGSSALTGVEWDPSQNRMSKQSDGTYQIIFKNIVAGTYGWKICKNGSYAESYNENGLCNSDNYANAVLIKSATSDVTITFDLATGKALASCSDRIDPDAIVYTVIGDAGLCGSAWDVSNTANDLTWKEGEMYHKIYNNVKKGSYQFKVVKDRNMGNAWGNSDGSNIRLDILQDGATVEIIFDAMMNQVYPNVQYEGFSKVTVFIQSGSGKVLLNGEDTSAKLIANGGSLTMTMMPAEGQLIENVVISDSDIIPEINGYEYTLSNIIYPINVYVYFNTDPSLATYTIAGEMGLCGTEWDPTNSDNDMTKVADGIYEKEYHDIPAGKYEFKVVMNRSWENSWGTPENDNMEVTAENANNKIMIRFHLESKKIETEVSNLAGVDTITEPTHMVRVINGRIFCNETFHIYTLSGHEIIQTTTELMKGIYIVKTMDGKAVKVIVK